MTLKPSPEEMKKVALLNEMWRDLDKKQLGMKDKPSTEGLFPGLDDLDWIGLELTKFAGMGKPTYLDMGLLGKLNSFCNNLCTMIGDGYAVPVMVGEPDRCGLNECQRELKAKIERELEWIKEDSDYRIKIKAIYDALVEEGF